MTSNGKIALAIGALFIIPKLFAKQNIVGYDSNGRPIYSGASGANGGYIDPRTGRYVNPYQQQRASGGVAGAIGSLLRGLAGGSQARPTATGTQQQQQQPRSSSGGFSGGSGGAGISPRPSSGQQPNPYAWYTDPSEIAARGDYIRTPDPRYYNPTVNAPAINYGSPESGALDFLNIGTSDPVLASPDIWPIQSNVSDDRTPYDDLNWAMSNVDVAIDPYYFDAEWFNNPMEGFDWVQESMAPIDMSNFALEDYSGADLYDAMGINYEVAAPTTDYDYYN